MNTNGTSQCHTTLAELLPATSAPASVVFTALSSTLSAASSCSLGRSERKYIEDGILQSHRLDGRSVLDFRPASVETDVLPGTYGSARVRTGDSELVVGVKCEIMSIPPEQAQNEGVVICSIDCSTSVDLEIEGKGGEDAGVHLAQLISSLCLGSSCIPRESLCIIEGKLAWKVFVDVVILNGAGSIIDAISIGVRAALLNTKLPVVEPIYDVDETTGEEKLDFEIDDRPERGKNFPAQYVPVCITVGQIKNRFVWDLTPEEETCTTSRLTVAVDEFGNCRGFHKSGESPLRLESCILALRNSCRAGSQIHRRLFLKDNEINK